MDKTKKKKKLSSTEVGKTKVGTDVENNVQIVWFKQKKNQKERHAKKSVYFICVKTPRKIF